jgi:ankyrin repeat protein
MKKLLLILSFLMQNIGLVAMQPYSDFACDCHETSRLQSPFGDYEYPHGFVVRPSENPFAKNQCATVLHHLAEQGDAVGVAALLKAGALMVPNQNGETPLHVAIKKHRYSVIEKIIQYTTDPTDCTDASPIDDTDASPIDDTAISLAQTYNTLHGLAQYGMVDAFETFVNAGTKITNNQNGETPFHIAAQYGQDLMLNAMLTIATQAQQYTPMDLICQKRNDGKTAFDLANAYGQTSAAEYIKMYLDDCFTKPEIITPASDKKTSIKPILRTPGSPRSPSPRVSIAEDRNTVHEYEKELNEE